MYDVAAARPVRGLCSGQEHVRHSAPRRGANACCSLEGVNVYCWVNRQGPPDLGCLEEAHVKTVASRGSCLGVTKEAAVAW